MLVARPEIRHLRVARHTLVLQRQEFHREVHAGKLAARDRQVARLLGTAGEHDGVELVLQALGGEGLARIAADALG